MNLTIKNILNLSIMKDAKLLSGHNKLDNPIKWINVMEVLDEYEQLQKGELLISTGYGIDKFTKSQFEYMTQSFINKGIAAIALQPGYYFKNIPENLISLAIKKGLPIIELPPKITWGKVTKSIYNEITKKEVLFNHSDKILHDFIFHILFGDESDNFPVINRAKHLGIELNNFHLFAVIRIKTNIDSIQTMEIIPYYELIKKAFNINYKIFLTYINNSFILLVETDKKDVLIYEKLKQSFNSLINSLNNAEFEMGVGNIYKNFDKISVSYNEALMALDTNQTKKGKTNYVTYHQLGILGLLMECDKVKLIDYVNYHIGDLINYDKENGTNYIGTLISYLSHLNHRETANSLFIHRHTLRYRLSRIEEILNVDISSPKALYNLNTSLIILKLFDRKKIFNRF